MNATRPVVEAEDLSGIVTTLLHARESTKFETKRASGKMVGKALETICAFANTSGGYLVIGLEDRGKASGQDRLYGVEENPEALDELRRKLSTHIIPPVAGVAISQFPTRLRDGSHGNIAVVRVPQSEKVHSILDDGTWVRFETSNREMTPAEIVELSYRRGTISAETELVDVDLELICTSFWRNYCANRGVTHGSDEEKFLRLGLAKRQSDKVSPTRAAVLLFSEEPGGLLSGVSARGDVRVFHYSGKSVERGAVPNLHVPPKTISGPLIQQIEMSYNYVMERLSKGLVLSSSGFKSRHRYPDRVIREAITNAIIHRDYHYNKDIHVRIFDNRIEIESPGLLPGVIKVTNIDKSGSFARNPMIARCLRDFPIAPNVDAGEGVPMMFSEMKASNLYPPIYREMTEIASPSLLVTLLNEERPAIWEEVSHWIDTHGQIANGDVCRIAECDTLTASKHLRRWVEQGLLEMDPTKGKRNMVYHKPAADELVPEPPGGSLSIVKDNN